LRTHRHLAVVICIGDRQCHCGPGAVSRIFSRWSATASFGSLAKVHPRYKTPYVSTLAVAFVVPIGGMLFLTREDLAVSSIRRTDQFPSDCTLGESTTLHSSRERQLAAPVIFPLVASRGHRASCSTKWLDRSAQRSWVRVGLRWASPTPWCSRLV